MTEIFLETMLPIRIGITVEIPRRRAYSMNYTNTPHVRIACMHMLEDRIVLMEICPLE